MTHGFEPGDRIVVTGGPWKSRLGQTGQIARRPEGVTHYPWNDLPASHVIVLLDADPLRGPNRPFADIWSCCLLATDIER